jgi:Protein of unknown function (DUF3617)
MRFNVILVLVLLCSFLLWAGDKIQPLDVKLGLWEITSTTAMTGMAMPNIPSDVLAKMTPEQRAKMQAAMGGTPTTTVRKVCITKEKMDKQTAFNDDRKNCTRTVVSSSSSKVDIKMQCTEQDSTINGTIQVEALNSENVKGSVRMAMTGGGRNLNSSTDFTSRYLGSACGDVK